MDLSDLLRMGKQYLSDAMPGGSLNPEVTRQSVLDGAAMAASPVPVLGDLLGLGADANRYATDPESRTPLNYGLTALGALPFVPAMTAWHGSPHKFDKFSLDKIGTGEGAQAYGHGLYLAESPEVAATYKAAQRDQSAGAIADKYLKNWGDRDKAVSALEQRTAKAREEFKPEFVAPYEEALSALKRGESEFNGQLYKTDIPDEAVARFLDWDKKLSEQAPEVQAALKVNPHSDPQASYAYQQWLKSNPDSTAGRTFQEASHLFGADFVPKSLTSQGIPGIRYLDGGSRSAGQGSSNFVAFDPEMIRILERNGQPTGLEPWKPGEYRLGDLLAR